MRTLVLIIAVLGLTGCASITREIDAKMYSAQAVRAQEKGDWDTARRAYGRALVNAEKGNYPVKERANLTFQYARALGMSCSFMRSETELLLAYELDVEAGNTLYTTLTELARVTLDKGNYEDANTYFARAFTELDRANMSVSAPVDYAVNLNEYAQSLAQAGRMQDADKAQKRSAALFAANPGQKAATDRFPYKQTCAGKK